MRNLRTGTVLALANQAMELRFVRIIENARSAAGSGQDLMDPETFRREPHVVQSALGKISLRFRIFRRCLPDSRRRIPDGSMQAVFGSNPVLETISRLSGSGIINRQ